MLLSLFVLLVVGGVAYFHYVQGFFSAAISAILAVLAAALAVSYHEPIVVGLLGGKFADVAPGMTLCVLFAVLYLLFRTVVDKFVPGNLRLPVLADKIGAGLAGVVAGLFTGGVLAIAAQSLPLGPSVGMFSRFEINSERDVQLPTSGQSQDTFVYDEMKEADVEKARTETRQALWVPADELLLKAVSAFSDETGSLAGSRPLKSVHPDYVEELYLSNVGIQVGAKRTAINVEKQKDVTVPDKGVFTAASLPQVEGEIDVIRKRGGLPATLSPKGSEMILVVRVLFDRKATDTDNKMRFSTGSARLVAGGKNYYPQGTLEAGKTVVANALDDFLVCDSDKGADLVYVVEKSDVLADAKAEPEKRQVADGVFVEVKRLGRVDLSGKKVIQGVTPSPQVQVLRKPDVQKRVGAGPSARAGGGGGSAAAPDGAAAGPLAFEAVEVNARLPFQVSTGTADATTNNFQTAGSTGALADGKFSKLEVSGTESAVVMSRGTYPHNELAAPAGQKVVKVHLTPRGDDPWAFESQIGNYRLVDASDQQHQPRGAVATVKAPNGTDRLVAKYNMSSNVGDIPRTDEGRPVDVWIAFTVPAGTQLKQVTYNGQSIATSDVTVQ